MTEHEMKPAYLLHGGDQEKLARALARLRARAEREGGVGALTSFAGPVGGAPDHEALLAAIPALSLTSERRYLLADGVERWSAKQAGAVIEALDSLPGDVTLVLLAREEPRRRAPKGLAGAVERAGGEVLSCQAPKPRDLPDWTRTEAARRGFELEPEAAKLLVDRLGGSTMRLANELDRLALWAEPGQRVSIDALAETIADTSEEVAWALSDAIVARNPSAAAAAAERLASQGEAVTPLIYQSAKRLREGLTVASGLERGLGAGEIESGLSMHPYAAKMLVRRVRGTSPAALRAATCAIADLEWWTRGGSDYPSDVALTLAVRRASGAAFG